MRNVGEMSNAEAVEVLSKHRILIELTDGKKSSKYRALEKAIEALKQKTKEEEK